MGWVEALQQRFWRNRALVLNHALLQTLHKSQRINSQQSRFFASCGLRNRIQGLQLGAGKSENSAADTSLMPESTSAQNSKSKNRGRKKECGAESVQMAFFGAKPRPLRERLAWCEMYAHILIAKASTNDNWSGTWLRNMGQYLLPSSAKSSSFTLEFCNYREITQRDRVDFKGKQDELNEPITQAWYASLPLIIFHTHW